MSKNILHVMPVIIIVDLGDEVHVLCTFFAGVWQTYVFNTDSPFSTAIQPSSHSPLRIRDLVGRDNWYDDKLLINSGIKTYTCTQMNMLVAVFF